MCTSQNYRTMTFASLLDTLYSDKRKSILNAINASVYSADFDAKNDYVVLHTGFTFTMQNGKRMELLFDIESQTIIRQVQLPQADILPGLTGTLYVKHFRPYFNAIKDFIVTGCYLDDDNSFDLEEVRDLKEFSAQWKTRKVALKNSTEAHELMVLYKANEVYKKLPLSKELTGRFFYNGDTFREPEMYHDRDFGGYQSQFGENVGSYVQHSLS